MFIFSYLFCTAIAFIQTTINNFYLDDLIELRISVLKEVSWKLSMMIQMQTQTVKYLRKNSSVSFTAFKSSYQQPPTHSSGLFMFLKMSLPLGWFEMGQRMGSYNRMPNLTIIEMILLIFHTLTDIHPQLRS